MFSSGTVVAGDAHKIFEFQTICKEQGLKCMILQASHAFHSKHMDTILPTYRSISDTIQTRNGKEGCKYVSGVRGKMINWSEINSDYWLDHTRNKVKFLEASNQVVREMEGSNKRFIEIGPQPILSAMLSINNSTDGLTCLPSLKRNGNDWETIATSLSKLYLAGVPVNWQGFYSGKLYNKVSIPHYPFAGKIFWPENNNQNQPTMFSIGEKLHPLIGTNIPNATGSVIFQNFINLKGDVSYLKEHKVGSNILFPAAGYIEMCLAAGYEKTKSSSSSSPPASPIKIENLCVDFPFALLEASPSEIQTVVELDSSSAEKDALKVNIFKKSSQSEKKVWIQNASAIYTPFASAKEISSISLDEKEFHSFFKTNEKIDGTKKLYKRFSVLGFNFGDVFKTLDKVWASTESKSILVQIKCPNDTQGQHDYIIHPIILDSMIQSVYLLDFVYSGDLGLHLPTRIGTFIFLSDIKIQEIAQNSSLFVHVEGELGSLLIIRLLDSSGKVLAAITDVDAVSTTVSALDAVILNSEKAGSQSDHHLPQLWEEVWDPQPKINETFEKNVVKHSGGKSIWILFEFESLICEDLSTRLASIGCRVIKVKAGKQFQKEENYHYVINDENKEDFVKLISNLNSGKIEGLIYAWPLDKSRTSQEQLVRPYLYMAQAVDALDQSAPPRVITLTTGVSPHAASDNHHSCLWGLSKSLQNERSDVKWRCIDIDSIEKVEMEELFHEIFDEGEETQVALIGGTRYFPKLKSIRASKSALSLPVGATRFELELTSSRTIGDLKFKIWEENVLDEFEVEVEIRSIALNFRDLFCVLERFQNKSLLGSDFAGVVARVGKQVTKWKIGDTVFGTSFLAAVQHAFPTHITMEETNLFPVPKELTLSDAACLPTVFQTVYKSLILVAKIKSSDTILIHTASGGVGLCAIQIAKHFGAKIIVTAGSKRKQDYLRSLGGIEHIFNSRNTQFQQDILRVTNGRGVDIVLNTLTSEGFKEATLAACAPSARFVELSKMLIWSKEDVKQLRPDVDYTIVDVDDQEGRNENRQMLEMIKPFIEKGIIRPLPYVRFDAVNIREALSYLQAAKHIGKVVCVMPNGKGERGEQNCPLFNERSSYIITGGLGGIGFEVAKWMLSSGAKHLILAGRKPPSAQVQKVIDQLNEEANAHIVPMEMDVGNGGQVRELLLKIKQPEMNLPQLRGIMHCAGVINDAFTSNQTWDKFTVPLNSKVDGTLNLHQLTIGYPLEHFVLFSSISALFGTPGQGNYAAANCFQDSFAHYRHSMGLPATSINWGAWGEVGMATEIKFPGLQSLSTRQGLAALEYALKSQKTQMCVVNVESFAKLSTHISQTGTYVDSKLLKNELENNNNPRISSSSSGVLKPAKFWSTYDSFNDLDKKKIFVQENLRRILRQILRLDEGDKLEDDASMQSMGADSLMFVEIRNSLQSLLGDRMQLSSSIIRDSSSISKLSSNLIGMIEKPTKISAQGIGPPSYESVNNLIRSDSKLPLDIKPNGAPAVAVGNIRQVLVTGATGFLGPYILRDLCKRKEIQTIYCLIRPQVKQNVNMRLEKALKKTGLSSSIDMTRVECIEGEITRPNLGMSQENWEKLSSSVDAVFHIAAKVNYADYYREMDDDDDWDTRKSNLFGVKNVLEFCCSTKTKQVYYASSTIAVAKTDSNSGSLSENWPNVDDFDGVTPFAYPVSKFVCDLYMKEAVKRGIPCKSFRLPIISGDSATGRLSLEQNHFMLRYFFMMRTGKMPSLPFPLIILPVDICSEVSLNLFFNEEAPPDVYTICHNHPNSDFDFIQVAKKFGYDISITEFSNFVGEIQKEPEEKNWMAFFKDFHKEEIYLNHHRRALEGWMNGEQNYFVTNKLLKYEPDFNEKIRPTIEYLQQDIQFAKEQGWFKKLGIEN